MMMVKNKYETAAAAAALHAEEQKRKAAQAAQGMKKDKTSTNQRVKQMLVEQLAMGEISEEVFKIGMSALD